MGSIDSLTSIRLKKAYQTLKVAKSLYENKFFTDSLSKSYYAIFYAAGAALQSIGIQAKRHATTIQKFNEHFIKNEKIDKEHYLTLSNAFRTRNLADYELTWEADEEETKDQLKRAEAFINAIEQLLK